MILEMIEAFGWLCLGGAAALIVTFIIFKVTQIISAAWYSGKEKARRR
jgi:hypothetical protein